ncbi:MAG: hypothetical protein U1E77_19200 [Inhella sp.]
MLRGTANCRPQIVVALRPSQAEAGEEELWVEQRGGALEDALRHGGASLCAGDGGKRLCTLDAQGVDGL